MDSPLTPSTTLQAWSSLPAASTSEADLSRPGTWYDQDDSDTIENTSMSVNKGKQKQTEHAYEDEDGGEGNGSIEMYPPTKEEEAETRRVQENLRRWEIAERQKRRAARESMQNTAPGSSLLVDVTRRASLLWSGNNTRHSSVGLGVHAPLRSQEYADGVRLNDIDAQLLASTIDSSSPSRLDTSSPLDDPFIPPTHSIISPFDDSHEQPVDNYSPFNTPRAKIEDPFASSKRASLTASHIPPISGSTNSLPPKPRPPPSLSPLPTEIEEPETRWWHEWLCGCGEGPDRGGDSQAGRTNPFE